MFGKKIKVFLSGRAFFYIILAIFAFQGLFFASAIKYKIPPDEKTHFMFAQYYAHRPVLSGPFINHQHDHFVLGDIQRTGSYLYQYLLSFPLRVVGHFTGNIQIQVFTMRLISVLLGIWSLYILAKLFTRLRITPTICNLLVLATSLTGMYVWIFSAINYDDLAIPLFFLLLLNLIGFAHEHSFKTLMWSTFFAMSLILTKFSYIPVILLAFFVVLGWDYRKIGKLVHDVSASIQFDKQRTLVVFMIVINLLFAGLIIERYGWNIVKYHSITPACPRIHRYSECLQTPNFSRNEQQVATFKKFKAQNGQLLSPIEFSGQWIELMYERIYFYFGHKYIIANAKAKDLAALTLLLVITFFVFRPTKLLINKERKLIAYIAIAYVAILFLYNLHSYWSTGAEFGFQGRYLLPVLPFLYAFTFLAVRNFYFDLKKAHKSLLLWGVSIIILANVYVHLPLLVFMRGTDNVWYTNKTVSIDNELKSWLRDAKLLHWTLPYGQ